jgi:RNA polymerase sigma-70 factor (family 1)
LNNHPALYEQFETLFREHYQGLAGYAFSITRNKDDAEDVVQNVFIKIWQNKPEIVAADGAKFYLYTATKNACISLLRKQAAVLPLDDQLTDRGEMQMPGEQPVTSVDYNALVKEAFSRLPPQCLAIFKLSRLANLTYGQIANELGLSVKTVENQMGKALRLMREFARTNNIPLPVLAMLVMKYFNIIYGSA